MALPRGPAEAWPALAAALTVTLTLTFAPGAAQPWRDCTGVACPPLEHCIEEALAPGACCATCVRRGCRCEGYQFYDCVRGGFARGLVPAGRAYLVDFGSTECACPPGGGRISCRFMPCPELPAHCIEAAVAADSCPQCARLGCEHRGRKYPAGHAVRLSPCRACHCPEAGGRLLCYPLPGCPRNASDAEDSDDDDDGDPDSYDLDLAEAEARELEAGELEARELEAGEAEAGEAEVGAGGPPAALEGRHRALATLQATPWPAALPRPTAATALGPPAPVQAKPRRVTEDLEEEDEEDDEDAGQEGEDAADPEPPATAAPGPTSAPASATVPAPEPGEDAGPRPEDNLLPEAEATPRSLRPPQATPSAPTLTATPRGQATPTRAPPRSPLLLSRAQAQEDTDPNSVHSVPRAGAEGSTKDLIATCCAAGQQGAIDSAACLDLPRGDAEGHVCRTARRQCCEAYLKERSCVAGVVAAQEGEPCGAEDSDTCGLSLYKPCCDCCGLGLRLRAEGQPCAADPNLGHPCGHALLACCQGRDPLILPPEPRTPPAPAPAPAPRRVSAEAAALSLGPEAEPGNSLPGECQRPGAPCQHLCVPSPGASRCACRPGFALQPDGRACRPDGDAAPQGAAREPELSPEPPQGPPNPIALPRPQPGSCTEAGPCQQLCREAGGAAACSCFPGFAIMADGVSCEDQDECLSGAHGCGRGQFCVNTPGSFHCASHRGRCAPGFLLNARGTCVDVDECVTALHTCARGQHCANTPGSFRCLQAPTCQPGFALTDGDCADVDECATGTHNCQAGFSCQNTRGSFYCQARQRCMDGFLQDPQGNCVDINECASLAEACRPGFSCVNTVGSYTCQRSPLLCRRGFHASEDGAACVDVNECETGLHRCGDDQLCHNLPGSYRCDCKPGFQRDAFGRSCVDVNECWASPGRLCQHTCHNTPGSYRCACAAGFLLAADGKHCEDVNECEASRCSQECANIYGSYQCYCRQGYQLAEDGHTCTDIDECAQGAAALCVFRCLNVPGSYQCACPEQGFTVTANGRTCKDVDECALGSHNCSAAETCYNLPGGFRCLRLDCPPNYVRVSDTSCERATCPDPAECQATPARISRHQLQLRAGLPAPAPLLRLGPAPAFAGDTVSLRIARGDDGGYFGTRRLNAHTGLVSLLRPVPEPRDFALDVEMKLWRQGAVTTFLVKVDVFVTALGP